MKRDQQSQSHLKGCRVLVLEDEYLLAGDLEYALCSVGAEVVGPIADLESARNQVAQDGFDVAILDINLSDQTTYVIGDELLRSNIPFVFATGYSSANIPARFRDITLWEKPYDLNKVVRDVGRLCDLVTSGGR